MNEWKIGSLYYFVSLATCLSSFPSMFSRSCESEFWLIFKAFFRFFHVCLLKCFLSHMPTLHTQSTSFIRILNIPFAARHATVVIVIVVTDNLLVNLQASYTPSSSSSEFIRRVTLLNRISFLRIGCYWRGENTLNFIIRVTNLAIFNIEWWLEMDFRVLLFFFFLFLIFSILAIVVIFKIFLLDFMCWDIHILFNIFVLDFG